MKLTFCTLSGTVHIEITPEQFKRLRDPSVTYQEIIDLARFCGIEPKILLNYVEDIKITTNEMDEIDGSCDYSDQL